MLTPFEESNPVEVRRKIPKFDNRLVFPFFALFYIHTLNYPAECMNLNRLSATSTTRLILWFRGQTD